MSANARHLTNARRLIKVNRSAITVGPSSSFKLYLDDIRVSGGRYGLSKNYAIFPPLELDRVESHLMTLGVPGMTVSRAHGFSEYRNFFAQDTMVDNVRVEVSSPTEKADEIVDVLSRAIRGEANCDGIIAVTPVENLIQIRRFS